MSSICGSPASHESSIYSSGPDTPFTEATSPASSYCGADGDNWLPSKPCPSPYLSPGAQLSSPTFSPQWQQAVSGARTQTQLLSLHQGSSLPAQASSPMYCDIGPTAVWPSPPSPAMPSSPLPDFYSFDSPASSPVHCPSPYDVRPYRVEEVQGYNSDPRRTGYSGYPPASAFYGPPPSELAIFPSFGSEIPDDFISSPSYSSSSSSSPLSPYLSSLVGTSFSMYHHQEPAYSPSPVRLDCTLDDWQNFYETNADYSTVHMHDTSK